MKKTLSLIATLCFIGVAMAGPVTPERAAQVARSFWTNTLHGKADAQLVNRTAEWAFDGIYLFAAEEGGFVLVAADDAARPILGYSPDGIIDPTSLSPALHGWLETYQLQIEWIRQNNGQSYASDREAWSLLESGKPLPASKSQGVGPLLTTHWDQQFPYNILCPAGTVTGCAATAQAQMMKYWNHPAFGIGSHSYVHSTVGLLQADFAHTLYLWDSMPDQPNSLSSIVERTAVATLMYHCGVGLEMNYGTAEDGGSAAFGLSGIEGMPTIDNSLKNYFGYSRDMHVESKDGIITPTAYTNEQWREMLIDELDLLHPLVYTGSATQGGHGFVCDGYDEREYMHFNFGWSGRGDGYFPVDSISPGVGGAGGNVTYTFNLYNSALFGAVPDYRLRVSDTLFCFQNTGGTDSLLFSADASNDVAWTVTSNADWLTVDASGVGYAGWIHFVAAPSAENRERTATITFTQGNRSISVPVIQSNYSSDDLCPVKVIMESLRNEGWQGDAHLSLQSAGGFIYGDVRLTEGMTDSVEVLVAPDNVYSVWHSGGGSDRFASYRILNQYGEELVYVERAYYDDGIHLMQWPCAPLAIQEPESTASEPEIWPNPTSDMLYIGNLPEGSRIELYDISGRHLETTCQTSLSLKQLPHGAYLLRIITPDRVGYERIIKQ